MAVFIVCVIILKSPQKTEFLFRAHLAEVVADFTAVPRLYGVAVSVI